MVITIAAAIALTVVLGYGIYRGMKPTRPKADRFVCHSCGERHCQCDREDR